MQNTRIQRCSIEDLYAVWSKPDGSQVIDVREYSEFAAEHIPHVFTAPLSALARQVRSLDPARTTYVVCHWGNRSMQAARKLAQLGFADVRVVDGGMLAWVAAELPVERGAVELWSLERQVRFTAGLLVCLSVCLSWLIHPAFVGLAAIVGAGLMHAAVTNACGMAMILAKLPWNQQQPALTVAKQAE